MVNFQIDSGFLKKLLELYAGSSNSVTAEFRSDHFILDSISHSSDLFITTCLKASASINKYIPDRYITRFTFDPKYLEGILKIFKGQINIDIPPKGNKTILTEIGDSKKEIVIYGFDDHLEFSWGIKHKVPLIVENADRFSDFIIGSINLDKASYLDIEWDENLHLRILDQRNSNIETILKIKNTSEEKMHLKYNLEDLVRVFQTIRDFDFTINLIENNMLHVEFFIDSNKTERCDIIFSCYKIENL